MIQNMNICRCLWGQIGGFDFFLGSIKSIVIYARLGFWGQRWGLYVPRFKRVIYSFKLTIK